MNRDHHDCSVNTPQPPAVARAGHGHAGLPSGRTFGERRGTVGGRPVGNDRWGSARIYSRPDDGKPSTPRGPFLTTLRGASKKKLLAGRKLEAPPPPPPPLESRVACALERVFIHPHPPTPICILNDPWGGTSSRKKCKGQNSKKPTWIQVYLFECQEQFSGMC